MNLFISGSNRKHNSYNFLRKLKKDDDINKMYEEKKLKDIEDNIKTKIEL